MFNVDHKYPKINKKSSLIIMPVVIQITPALFESSFFRRLKIIETKITLSIPNKISIKVRGIKLNKASVVKIEVILQI